VVEGARLESVFRGNSNVGSNPTLSASIACSSGPQIARADLYNNREILSKFRYRTGLTLRVEG
jgi:hypothetical protein